MSALDARLVGQAADYMLDAVRARYPQAADSARELFEAQASTWDAAHVWAGPQGVVVLTEAVGARWGAPEAHLHVLTDGSPEAADWVATQTTEIRAALGPAASCRVSFGRRELVAILQNLGLGISKVGLGGEVPRMLARLAGLPVIDPASIDLRLEPVSTIEHVRASSALRRDYFVAHPEHGWASGTLTDDEQRAIDERVERELAGRLERANGTDFVLLEDDEVVGAFGFTAPQDSPVVGRNASFNICIAPSAQGRGLGTLAYATMITRAAELGVDHMHGSTSNPGVLRIGARIGRHIDNWLMRLDPPWVDSELAMNQTLLRTTEYASPGSS